MVAPSRVRSSPHTFFAAPLPTQSSFGERLYRSCQQGLQRYVDRTLEVYVGSGAAKKVCGLERTREGATMGNFNFSY